MRFRIGFISSILFFYAISGFSQNAPSAKWSDRINLRGYVQVRYNRLLETNPNLGCEQCDKSWGADGGFFLRRLRLIFSGDLNDRVYFYIQPDFASSAGSNMHYGQIRDAYIDLALDIKKEYRFRVGQSKVPYGFENMQSSQNRLPLDRADPTNSALRNERDLGVFFYWAPQKVRQLYSYLVRNGFKGSGDYGVFAFGAYNGQTANSDEENLNKHIVTRFSYPIQFANGQIIEPGIQAYSGKYVLTPNQLSTGVKVNANKEYIDERVAATFVLYPKPFGIQAEYNVGRGPEFDKNLDSITTQNLKGGYITASYFIKSGKQTIIPFTRYQYYDGGKKHELDARSYQVNELEIGFEWQPNPNFELVAHYTISRRRYEDFKKQNNYQTGNLLRLQAQLNF